MATTWGWDGGESPVVRGTRRSETRDDAGATVKYWTQFEKTEHSERPHAHTHTSTFARLARARVIYAGRNVTWNARPALYFSRWNPAGSVSVKFFARADSTWRPALLASSEMRHYPLHTRVALTVLLLAIRATVVVVRAGEQGKDQLSSPNLPLSRLELRDRTSNFDRIFRTLSRLYLHLDGARLGARLCRSLKSGDVLRKMV